MYNRKQMLRNNSCLFGGGAHLPPKFKFTKEQILSATLELVRKEGLDAVTARKVAEALHASSKVIFGLFDSMEALQNAHREDLIGSGPKCLIRAVPPKVGGYTAPPPKPAGAGEAGHALRLSSSRSPAASSSRSWTVMPLKRGGCWKP